jgi:hypothetical protein
VTGFPLPRRGPAVGTDDLPALRAPWRRTAILRLVLALLALALALAAAVSARGLRTQRGGLLPNGTSGIIVLDLSQSVATGAYREITSLLKQVIRANTRTGLVVFSDTAYEMVPPGSPGAELRPVLRYFTPLPGSTALDPIFLQNPWTDAFRGGTRISSGLETAREALHRDHIRHGSVLLVSDLDTAGSDVTLLTQSLLAYRKDHLPLRLMALDPQPDDRFFFERLIGKDAFDTRVTKDGGVVLRRDRSLAATVPRTLLLVSLALLALLAANELFCGRLPLPRRHRGTAA